jgi:hypothetical protein
MTVYTAAEGNEAAAYIQGLHAFTHEAWMSLLLLGSNVHPNERQRRRQEYERQVRAFNEQWAIR